MFLGPSLPARLFTKEVKLLQLHNNNNSPEAMANETTRKE